MMKYVKLGKVLMLLLLICLPPHLAFGERIFKDKVTVDYEILDDGTYKIIDVYNTSSSQITLFIDNAEVTVNAGSSAKVNKIARNIVSLDSRGVGKTLLKCTPTVASTANDVNSHEVMGEQEDPSVSSDITQQTAKNVTTRKQNKRGNSPSAIEFIEQDEFFGTEAVAEYVKKAESLAEALSQADDKEQFLVDNDIKRFLAQSESDLQIKKNEITDLAEVAVATSKIKDKKTQAKTLNSLIDILDGRYNLRQTVYQKLQNMVDSVAENPEVDEHPLKEMVINYSIIGVIVLVLALWMIFAIRRKRNNAKSRLKSTQTHAHYEADPNNQNIVVRRRTTSILKKLCIDDVINNPEYLLINTAEFTQDSAVRNIYVKNSCIKEVYNLYADDLRNSDNPNEDGCMVLGRWVYNEDSHTYDISLEIVVFPGDDAVFKEYELNFGGKIKLRIADKLRKLRRDTNLQYDLVCWIHSHPGLGVFFSNSDDGVQMQLKHSQHPYFLTAFVVDILTTDQEMGIFTFRKDGTMNSKGDLTKLYSLEEMYKWALDSDNSSFNPDNYHNILESAKMHIPSCQGIELNNNSIIDLTQIIINPSTGIVGWAIGTFVEGNEGKEYIVSGIVKAEEKPTTGVVGILLNVTHMSLPTIQRIIANENANISFVLVYSSRQNTLTSIPVINGELVTDEHFYGEETIDNLKIWTRRKR